MRILPAVGSFVGTSGYDYRGWRGDFYPSDLPRTRWLPYLATQLGSVELNGTFYSLKNPDVFRRWDAHVADPRFVFAVKGSRFITHQLKLRNAQTALANFFASGLLVLRKRLGPILWQLPATVRFEPERLERFLAALPRTQGALAALARGHDARLRRGALADTNLPGCRVRHAFEVRHSSFFDGRFFALLRAHRVAWVVADSAGKFPRADEVTADFVYVRLHGSTELYASGYSEAELRSWARRIRGWQGPGPRRRDVYVYFDNDARGHAPHDAVRLRALLE